MPRYLRTRTATRGQSPQRPIIAANQIQTDAVDVADVASTSGREIWNQASEANPDAQRPSPFKTRPPVRPWCEARESDPSSRTRQPFMRSKTSMRASAAGDVNQSVNQSEDLNLRGVFCKQHNCQGTITSFCCKYAAGPGRRIE